MAKAVIRMRNGTIVRYSSAQQLVHGLGDFVLVYSRDKQGREHETAFQMRNVSSTELISDTLPIGFKR